MRNIIRLAKQDIARVRQSVIARVVVLGLVIVPVLYAWFNIAGSWDPYGNTGNIHVAVANSDAGYESDLVPLRVNLGETVVSSLRANNQLAWEFVDERQAIEGVKSGAYYAAVVIPPEFSARMMTVFSSDVEHAELVYYENQKANAIAPRVTDKAASTVRQQVDETFAETLGSVGMTAASELLEFVSGDEVAAFAGNLSATLDAGIADLRDASEAVGSLAGVMSSSNSLLTSTGDLLVQAQDMSANDHGLAKDAREALSQLQPTLEGAVAAVNQALDGTSGSYEAAGQAINQAFDTVGAHVDTTVEQLNGLADTVAGHAASMRDAQARIKALEADVEGSDLPSAIKADLVQKIDIAQNGAGNVANQQELLAGHLRDAATTLNDRIAVANQQLSEAQDLLAQAKEDVAQVQGTYSETLKAKLTQLADTMNGLVGTSEGLSGSLGKAVGDLSKTSTVAANDLAAASETLTHAASSLATSVDELTALKSDLSAAAATGDAAKIRELIGSDPAALAATLAAPVALDRQPVYHIENYGSAMAPFYTTLSLWVGGIVLAAMLKAQVDEDTVCSLAPVRLHELYLGRYVFFAVLAFAQATLVCAGDLWFFGIQCSHPFQFMLTGWVAGFVFSNIIYTLTVSFGDVGKAIAVVLLVMQVAGSGGTFPIEMTAPFFQSVYPLLPFTHAINAMHAAMAGAYGMEFWMELGILACYLLPSLALGLLLRRPVIRANAWIVEKLEETHLM